MIHELAMWCSHYIVDLAMILAFTAVCIALVSIVVGMLGLLIHTYGE